MDKKRVGVIGCGQWGPNQIRSFFFHPKTRVVRICDTDPARVSANLSLYPGMDGTGDYRRVTRAADIDAVVITTPVFTHFEIARDALLHGKDVLCEKPLAIRSSECAELTRLAAKKKRVLMVGHVFLFNPGIVELKKLIGEGEIGNLHYLHAQRTNLGPVRRDVNAVYDLASHDISIFNYLLGGRPKVLSATGKCYLQKKIEDVVFVSLEYPGNVLAHVHVSWLDPKKVRRITVVGDKKMMTWNDMTPSGPVEIYSKHVERGPFYKDFGEFQMLVKEGEVRQPHVHNAEPLKQQTSHFVDRLFDRKKPLTDGAAATEIVRTLEEIEKILKKARR